MVVFISIRCPISNAYNRRMEAIYKDYSSSKGVKIRLRQRQCQRALKGGGGARPASRLHLSGLPGFRQRGRTLQRQVTPETYVIDKQGIIRYHGAIDDSQNEARIRKQGLRSAFDEVLAGKAVTVAETKAFGCSVKRARPHRPTD